MAEIEAAPVQPVDIPPFQLEIIRKEATLAAMAEVGRMKRLAFFAGVGTGLSPIVALTPDWADFYSTPTFTGLAMGVFFGTLGAVYVDRNLWARVKESLNESRHKPRKLKGE